MMTDSPLDAVQIGDHLPTLTTAPVSRTTLALFAGASGDHNPIHIDIDFAQKAGMDDVFAQGMLPMAYLGQLLTNWVPQSQIREFSTRFVSITHLRDEITCTGTITDKLEKNGEKLIQLEITAKNQKGDIKLSGSALIALA